MLNKPSTVYLFFLLAVNAAYGQETKSIRIGYPSVSTTQSLI